QLRSLRRKLEDNDSRLEEAERRAKTAEAQISGSVREGPRGSESGMLREEERLFHELLAARDELSAQRAAMRELEGQLLERDAANVELRFDLEARAAEADRLRRRASELQAEAVAAGGGGGGGRDGVRQPGGRFKRERDLESVVDALKRVVEKLRSENDRLRRGAAEGAIKAEADKAAKDAKRRASDLQVEVSMLRGKASAADDAVQRLAQKQDMINQLRRQLRSKEADIKRLAQRAEDLQRSKAAL
ncbi:unnamed protein product, partial [Choristocarpus tenellus]